MVPHRNSPGYRLGRLWKGSKYACRRWSLHCNAEWSINCGNGHLFRSQNRSNRPSSSLPNLQQSPASPFTDAQSGAAEAPDLTGRIVRLGSAPFATGGYCSVWRGNLPTATLDDPNGSLQVLFSLNGFCRSYVLTADALGCHQSASCFAHGRAHGQTEAPQGSSMRQ
jgi:hypothetical protein